MVQKWTPPERSVNFPDRSSAAARALRARDAATHRTFRSISEAIDDYRSLAFAGTEHPEAFADACLERWRSRWGRRPVHAITSIDVGLYFHELALKDFSRAELDRDRWYLAFFFAWLRHNRMSFSSPVDRRRVPLPAPVRQRVVIWNADDQRRLLDACRRCWSPDSGGARLDDRERERAPSYLRPLVLLSLETGLRLGNLLYLEWRHVDLLTDTIRIPAPEVRTGTPLEFRIPPASARLLHSLWQATSVIKDRSTRVLERLGLPSVGGAPDARRVHEDFFRARRRAGIRPGGFESLRWTFAYNAARAGVPFRRTATVIDWSDLNRLILVYQRFGRRPAPPAGRVRVQRAGTPPEPASPATGSAKKPCAPRGSSL